MGGMHTWLWGERYPEMMDGLFPISSLPVEIGGRNRLWRHMVIEAIRNDPEWQNGDYERQPHGSARMAPLVAMMVGSPVRQYEKYPTRVAADAWYEQIVQQAYTQRDTNDRLYYYDASRDYNPAPDLEKIKAKLLLIVFADDQINSPEFEVLVREAPRVKNGRYVIIPAGKESDGEANNDHAEIWGVHMWSGALLRGDGGKRGPALLDVLAAAVRTGDIFFLMPSNGQSLQKGFLAVAAEEFVVGHTDLHSAEKDDGRILDSLVGRFNMGSGHGFCAPGSQTFREVRVADSARFSGLELGHAAG
jgi:hypothetical protein